MQSGTQEKASAQETVTSRPILFIVKFVVLWLASLIVVLAVTLLNDVSWSRPYMERSLGQILNRQVKLGKMNWSLGLNGIAIGTKTLSVDEISGAPFLTAKHSEIGLSVLGLLQRQIVITYIEADQANLRLVKTATNKWNFDDLWQQGPEIRLVQLTGSKINVYDESTPQVEKRIAPVQLEKVEMKVNFPKKNRTRPFFVSFSMPSAAGASTFTLDGLGIGEIENWKTNHYTFKADARKINPRDLERIVRFVSVAPEKAIVAKPVATESETNGLTGKSGGTQKVSASIVKSKQKNLAGSTTEKLSAEPHGAQVETDQKSLSTKPAVANSNKPDVENELLDLLRSVEGNFNFAVTGDGTFEKGIKATVETTADGLLVKNKTYGHVNAGTTEGSLDANISSNKLAWSNLVLKLRGLQMRSSGQLSHWQKDNPEIKAVVNGSVPDLSVLKDLWTPKAGPTVRTQVRGFSGLTQTLQPAQLTGRAEVEIKIDGTATATNLTTKVKTHDLAIKDMLSKAHERFPILCAIGLSNQAKIETDLRVQNADRLELVNGKLIGPGTNLSATGWLDLKSNDGELTITGDNIALNNTAVAISNNDGAFKQVLGCIKLPGKNSFTLGGTATAYVNLKTEADRYALDAKAKLKDAVFALKDNSLKLEKVNGNITVVQTSHGGTMTLSGITGNMGEGNFQMDGKINIGQAVPTVDITLHATRFDMKHLSTMMKLFQIQEMPVLTERQLYGRVKDVVLKATGPSTHPNIFFNAVPDDLYYQPPGLAKPLRAKSGVIVYDKDQLILREVAMISNGKTILTSLTIDKVSKECILSRAKCKTDSMELADINYYLSSTAMPPPMRQAYKDCLAKYKISGMSGKIYGDILCLIGPKGDVTFDGLIGCYKTAATVFGYPITKIEGIFAASGDQLLLQDLSGYLRGSKVSLDGYIDKYRSKNPSWRAEVAAKLAPRELIELIPHLTDEMKTSRVEVHCKGPLTLRAKVQGNFDYNKIQYSLVADKKDHLTIEGPFGKVYQPPDSPLTLDGLVGVNKSIVTIGDTHILIGQSLINLDGLLTFPEEEPVDTKSAGKAKVSEIDTDKPSPMVRLNFRVPQKSPVNTLVAMFDPPLAKEISGTINGFLTLDGDLHSPKIMSDLSVNNISVPAFKITGLNGRLRSGGKQEIEGPKTQALADAVPIVVDSDASAQAADAIESSTQNASKSGGPAGATPAKLEPAVATLESLTSKDSVIEVSSVKIRQLPVTNMKAHVTLTYPEASSKDGPTLKIYDGQARIADGVMKFDATLKPADNHIWINALFSEVSAARITDELMGSADELTGKGKASIVLETHGEDNKQMTKNLKGHGSIEVENGTVHRVSDLETRLTQYNLLTQGVFGFNVNNLVQSVWPVKTGEFTSLTNKFSFADGSLKIEEMRFNGKDMRMWGTGSASLINNKIKFEMAGKIPRVIGSRLGGGLGEVSKNITIQKMMKFVTLGRLENLPSLPVLGAIATDKPRTFTFNIDSELDNPKTIARSIEKSFKWLQNKPDATAHPVPGVVTPM